MTGTPEPSADAEAGPVFTPARRPPRPPSLFDALLLVVVLIGLEYLQHLHLTQKPAPQVTSA